MPKIIRNIAANAKATAKEAPSATSKAFPALTLCVQICQCFAVAFAFCATFALTGCSVSLEDTGGIADPKATEPTNLVDPSQGSDSSFLFDTSIADLTDATSTVSDGQTVKIEGEVVGDIRNADFDDTHFWITLQEKDDDITSTITVYCTEATTNLIDTLGAYGRRGTTLSVSGTFHVACSEHDGMPDVHAQTSSIKAQGNSVQGLFDAKALSPAILTFVSGLLLLLLYNYLSWRKKMRMQVVDEDEDLEDEN